MFVLLGQEDEREMEKENREVEATRVERAGLQELEKRLERAAPPRQQAKLSSTLQVLVPHSTTHQCLCSNYNPARAWRTPRGSTLKGENWECGLNPLPCRGRSHLGNALEFKTKYKLNA